MGPLVVLEGGAVSHERGTHVMSNANATGHLGMLINGGPVSTKTVSKAISGL